MKTINVGNGVLECGNKTIHPTSFRDKVTTKITGHTQQRCLNVHVEELERR